jgi:hypothetical protein
MEGSLAVASYQLSGRPIPLLWSGTFKRYFFHLFRSVAILAKESSQDFIAQSLLFISNVCSVNHHQMMAFGLVSTALYASCISLSSRSRRPFAYNPN